MADIELVIKIPENTYKQIQALARNNYFEHDICGNSMRRIANGTPLPKGHGDLKDSKLLDARLNFVLNHTGGYKNTPIGTGIVIAMAENLDAPTIIEADKAESEE